MQNYGRIWWSSVIQQKISYNVKIKIHPKYTLWVELRLILHLGSLGRKVINCKLQSRFAVSAVQRTAYEDDKVALTGVFWTGRRNSL